MGINNIVKGVATFYDESEEKGVAKIKRFYIGAEEAMWFNLRASRDGAMFMITEGWYCKLVLNGGIMMSDTPMERRSNREFIKTANGRVLVAGLGVGLVIHNILEKENVTEVVVVEKYQDVIDLVAPKFNHPKLKIICADIFEHSFDKAEKFDTIYFDIWADITTENLTEMKLLHARYRKNLNKENELSWMESWLRDYLKKVKRQEKRYYFNSSDVLGGSLDKFILD